MTVPLSLAVANMVPVALRHTCATGDLCAWMMLVTDRDTASKRRTSPVECCEADVGAAGGVEENGVAGEGRGEG